MKPPFSKHVTLAGSEKPAPKAKKIGKTEKSALINVTVKLRSKEPLPDLLDPKVYQEFSPLSHDEFNQKYGSSENDVKMVSDFANKAGLSVVKTELNKRTIELRGTVAQMEKAFKVTLANYKGTGGKVFRGRRGSIKIPA